MHCLRSGLQMPLPDNVEAAGVDPTENARDIHRRRRSSEGHLGPVGLFGYGMCSRLIGSASEEAILFLRDANWHVYPLGASY